MSIANIKSLLELNQLQVEESEIKAKIKSMGLIISRLSEDDVSRVVNSFLKSEITTRDSSQLSNQIDESVNNARKSNTSKSVKADIEAFEEGVKSSSNRIAKNEANRIYQESIAALPSNVVAEFVTLANQHQGNPDKFRAGGEQIISALFADFS